MIDRHGRIIGKLQQIMFMQCVVWVSFLSGTAEYVNYATGD